MITLENIFLIVFFLWGLPLMYYRSNFRKTVYRTSNWRINIQPRFGKEIKALLGNIYPKNQDYIRRRNFYRFYLIIYFLLFGAFQITANSSSKNKAIKMKTIETGDKIPEFELPNQNGEKFKVNSVIGKKKLVLFFYPKDDTPGCTKEACYFRDQYEAFLDLDAEVIGISGQSVKSHKQFAEKYNLTYRILSDQGNKIRKEFGVPTNFFGLAPGRVTYVIDKTGTVIHTFNSQSDVLGHVDEALKVLKESD